MDQDMNYHRWARENPDLGNDGVSVESCHSEEYFERERENIFRKTWLMVGHVADVEAKGDYRIIEMPFAHTSLLVVRGRDQAIRAFHNMCPHRGNRLVWEEKGCARGSVFVCPFHRWTFDLSGKLRGVTDEANFFDLDKDALGLTPVRCETWNGFIFVNFDTEPEQDLATYLDGLGARLKDYPFGDLRFAFGWTVDEKANWKVALDAQNETYHVPYLHSVGQPAELFAGNAKGAIRNNVFERFGRHTMFGNAPNADMKLTPVEAFIFGVGPEPFAGDSHLVGSFNFYLLFPNSAVVLFPGGVVANHRMWPIAADRTRWEIRTYARAPRNAGEALAIELYKVMGRNALQEDAANHERIQSTLKSGAIKTFALQDEEIQIRFFHKVVDDYVAGKIA